MRRKLPDELRGRKVKKRYEHDDFYRIRILMYLSHHEKGRLTDIMSNGQYGIASKKTALRLLAEMIDAGWVKKTIDEYHKTVKIYSLGEKGDEMKYLIRVLQENHPLFDCKSFIGIKSLG